MLKNKFFYVSLSALMLAIVVVALPAQAALTSTLGVGSRGAYVSELQKTLKTLKYYGGPITGYYGALTKAAVIKFQKANKLTPASGAFNAATLAKLKQLTAVVTVTPGTNQPPAEAIAACSGKAVGAVCEFLDKTVLAKGVCSDKPGIMACSKGQTAGAQPGPDQKPTSTKPVNAPVTSSQSQYNIEQAISDNAQLNTMAFGGLGFLTGNTCSDSFLPPGKVADFFGFQYLRDVTQAGKGHSTDFVTNAANNVLKTLTATQKAQMLALAKSQASQVNEFALKRFPLMVAFRRQLDGAIPSGTTGLSKSSVMSYSSDLYALDGQISLDRAKLFSSIIGTLSADQKAYLDTMVKGGFASWTALPDQLDKSSMTHDENVLMMTYASEMFAWYAGDVEADTYFCPERQADYFGGFYLKDAPAMGNAGYTIDESITGDQGQAFINALNTTQKPIITNIITTQKSAITGIVEKRRAIATELRKLLAGGTISDSNVLVLSREYGALDGEISYYYATAFSQVGNTLTTAQKLTLTQLRGLTDYPCAVTNAYLYSEKITMPTVINTDFLFQ